jgi:DNA helicase II / ATP-dependent DNA helicase PcrA
MMTGDPRKDWGTVKRLVQAPGEDWFGDMASELDYLIAFGRGRRIAEGLSSVWLEHGAHLRARAVLDNALLRDQLLAGAQAESGIYVMNTHKARGKQFDGVLRAERPCKNRRRPAKQLTLIQ